MDLIMKFFTFQILDSLAETYKKSVGDEKISDEIKDFAKKIGIGPIWSKYPSITAGVVSMSLCIFFNYISYFGWMMCNST